MKTHPSRKQEKAREKAPQAYHVATCGRERVPVYKRIAPNGSPCFMVVNYSTGKRRFDSYANAAEAIEKATKLARQMSEREVLAAAMTNEQASEYAAAVQKLAPFNVGLLSAADTVAECLKLVGDLPGMIAAAKFYRQRHKQTTPKLVVAVITELIAEKEARGASERYLQDLRSRLNRFAESFQKEIGNVTTADVQAWLDAQKKLSSQTHVNYRRVLHLLFKFALARGYCLDNPADGVERVKVRSGDVEIFTPAEIARLLAHVSAEALPAMAIGAFAGLRTAEIQRLEWSALDFEGRNIVVGAAQSKTASRRVVPMPDNLAAWLAPQDRKTGRIWERSTFPFHAAWRAAAAAAGVPWKPNALRHSFASYRLAQTQNAAQVSLEMGNSPQMIFRHYRELVKPADAMKWFAVKPETPANVAAMPAVAT